MKMNWTDLVKARIKELGITQEKLAELVEVTPGGMGHWLNKRREPTLEQIAKILKAVQLDKLVLHSDGTLEYPDEALGNTSAIDIQPAFTQSFPVLSSVQAGNWAEAVEPYTIEEINEWYQTTERTSGHCFWLRVKGDSMTSATDISFPEGTLVLVDTEKEIENGSYVVAKLVDVNEATFKKLVIDAGQKFLKPLNTSYPQLPINGNCKIIGVVVDAKMKLF
ncbi:helix-turn-helix domain-containing protein [Vibrio parahaemolyticus]|nr:S24 family peptidase [Vibrio parahaemolyticus]MCX8871552.1 helix-turn-helix domain-containing protein [Vibrio parahaemolyticus]